MIELTSPLNVGANGLMAPVVALNARKFVRVSSVELVALRTWVNCPPRNMVLPTWAIALTWPSRTWGVKFDRGRGYHDDVRGLHRAGAGRRQRHRAITIASRTASVIVRRFVKARVPITTSPTARPAPSHVPHRPVWWTRARFAPSSGLRHGVPVEGDFSRFDTR